MNRYTWIRALRWVAALGVLAVVAACGGMGGSRGGSSDTLLVWVDGVRTPGVQQYKKAHKDSNIRVVTIPNKPGYILTKVSLANKSGDGWPDVVFLNSPSDISSLASKKFHYATALNDLVPEETIDGFAPGALPGCTFDDKVYCLRTDLGQTMLWYNQDLMKKFGYEVPTSWKDYAAIGKRLVREHPGYVSGTIGGKWGAGTYFANSECRTRSAESLDIAHIDTSAKECTRVAKMLQPLVEKKTVRALTWSDPAFVKLAKQGKVLMLPGPSWFGIHAFKDTYKTPKGQMAAAPMPMWPDQDSPVAGTVGGGMWAVSKHASHAEQQAAADLITWMTTDIGLQKKQPTYPAYAKAAKAWCKSVASSGYFASNPCPVMKQAAGRFTDSHDYVRYQPEWWNSYDATFVSAAKSGDSLTDALQKWQNRLVQAAKNAGYKVDT